jgi:cytochrome oxidase Cu insertion factor (SCO1/SenC/PrrC family)
MLAVKHLQQKRKFAMKCLTTKICLTLGLLLTAAVASSAQTTLGPKDGAGLPPTDLERVKVGDAAPDFTLEDQDGKPVTLSAYRGKRTVVLVFYRGYW